jgi:hypothetical protein
VRSIANRTQDYCRANAGPKVGHFTEYDVASADCKDQADIVDNCQRRGFGDLEGTDHQELTRGAGSAN